ncbi:hypothetical protein F4561_004119 [Lipingzhangella halophila]|uniref:Uncharacterized protein n=1 Tax=Lipingzhangella halophila TaxID=1783352 RepID=A0A7W7W4Y7_9ACTN|nr:hypothetical protein [Lipingzhangella halophila]MBB4933299.1 hypothetical protein [Lipingzhangella halophila]
MTGTETTVYGVDVRPLDDDETTAVFADVFGAGRRCAHLDTLDTAGGPQWLLAELGDARITGYCAAGTWRLESSHRDSGPLAGDRSDAWRLLEAVVFTEHAQIRIGEEAGFAHSAVDSAGVNELPGWLRPRDRSFLLLGWSTEPRHTTVLDGEPPMTRSRELSGSAALHPDTFADFGVLPSSKKAGKEEWTSKGSWLSVREYWAQDTATGAVHVAFHRLTGYHTGPKPTAPLITGAPSALEEDDE